MCIFEALYAKSSGADNTDESESEPEIETVVVRWITPKKVDKKSSNLLDLNKKRRNGVRSGDDDYRLSLLRISGSGTDYSRVISAAVIHSVFIHDFLKFFDNRGLYRVIIRHEGVLTALDSLAEYATHRPSAGGRFRNHPPCRGDRWLRGFLICK